MASAYSVTLDKIINEFGLESIYLPCDASEISITSQEVNRPGLILAGNDKYFDPARVQYLGFSEFEFVKSFILFCFVFFGPKMCGISVSWPEIELTHPEQKGEVSTLGSPGKLLS